MEWMDIVQWLLPAGGIGGAIGWLTSRAVRQVRGAKEVHDAYQEMYEDVKTTLEELRHENRLLRNAFYRLARSLRKINACEHYHACPVRHELRDIEAGIYEPIRDPPKRPAHTKKRRRGAVGDQSGDDPEGGGADASSDGQPAALAPRGGVYRSTR